MTDDVELLRRACFSAVTFSHDPHTQNGAVLVANEPGGPVVISAANGLPAGVCAKPERMERPGKYAYVEHAERAVIFAAARMGLKTAGATLYCPWFACADCARAIICAGITRVVGHVKPRSVSPERWAESIRQADEMLREAEVEIALLDAPLGVRYLFNGEPLEL